jgi:acyl carrier protein
MKIKEEVINIITSIFVDNKEFIKREMKDETSLEAYGIDSFQFINLIVEIEKAFSIEIPDELLSFEKLDTISSIVKCIEELVNENDKIGL